MVRAIVCGALLLTSVATASLVLTTHEAFAQSACRQCNFDCRNKPPSCMLRKRQCHDRCQRMKTAGMTQPPFPGHSAAIMMPP